jgi:hypothetical protein
MTWLLATRHQLKRASEGGSDPGQARPGVAGGRRVGSRWLLEWLCCSAVLGQVPDLRIRPLADGEEG